MKLGTPPDGKSNFLSDKEVLAEAKAWALNKSLPQAQAQAVVQSWLDGGNTVWTAETLHNSLDGFFRAANLVMTEHKLSATHEKNTQAIWAIECIKHIALTNLAGIAGAVTLLASDNAKPGTQGALVFFILGSLASILTMLLGAGAFGDSATANRLRAYQVEKATKWEDIKNPPSPRGKDTLGNLTAILIITSLTLTTLGAGWLVFAYW